MSSMMRIGSRAVMLALLVLAAACGQPSPLSPEASPPVIDAAFDVRAVDRARPDTPRPDVAPLKQKLRVLFVGNSYTFVNDLPATLVTLAASVSQPPDLQVSSRTVGGATFLDHVTNTATVADIGSGSWTHVVLQGNSLEPLTDPTGFAANGLLLAQKASSASSRPLFYETWARKAGNAVYAQAYSGGSPAAMQALLRAGYEGLATKSSGGLARVGDAWEAALTADPTLALHADDGSHPSVLGTYLAACVFYGALAGKSPLEITSKPSSTTTDAVATTLKTAAAKVTK
jgi:hypothetical protein